MRSILKRRRRARLWAFAALATLARPGLAQVLVLDGNFSPGDWTSSYPAGAAVEVSTEPSGGIVGSAFYRVQHTHPYSAFFTQITSDHLYRARTLEPGVYGGVDRLVFSFETRRLDSPPLDDDGNVGFFPIVRQAGRVFMRRSGSCQELVNDGGIYHADWRTFGAECSAGDFDDPSQPGLQGPDFSAGGGAIEVGFRYLTSSSGSFFTGPKAIPAGLDNFAVEFPINDEPRVRFRRSRLVGGILIAGVDGPPDFELRIPVEQVGRAHAGSVRVVAGQHVPGNEVRPAERGSDVVRFPPRNGAALMRFTRAVAQSETEWFLRLQSFFDGLLLDEPSALIVSYFDTRALDRQCTAVAQHALACFLEVYKPEACPDRKGRSGGRRKATAELELLPTLSAVRDRVLASTATGRYYVNLYRTLSPRLIAALFEEPSIVLDIAAAQDAWLGGLQALVDGRGDQSTISPDMANDLLAILARLKRAGGSSLARALEHEEEALGLAGIAGLTMDQAWQRVNERGGAKGCVASPTALCLNGARFRVETDWETADGQQGAGQAVPLGSDSGYFWFFGPANVESVVKVLDACSLNQRYWAFAAGLTNVEVVTTVTDTWTGAGKSYVNAQGTAFAPIQDTDAVKSCGAAAPASWVPPHQAAAAAEVRPVADAVCAPSATGLCLRGGRFLVTAEWETAQGESGAGRAVPLTGDTGTFWFFSPGNTEVIVKVLDACGLNDHHWVFAGGLTNVRVTLRVTDTETGEVKTYRNPQGQAFRPVQDTSALGGCPASSATRFSQPLPQNFPRTPGPRLR